MRTRARRLILLADDHAAVRHALAGVLAEEGIGDCGGRARGYIAKREPPPELARAVREILEGRMIISPRAAGGIRRG